VRIEVVRTGGFAGIRRTATLDTASHPDGPHLAALAEAVLAGPRASHPAVPDGFSYTITVGAREVRCGDPHLTAEQRSLIQAVLGEGA
jgi:hypothetical protein